MTEVALDLGRCPAGLPGILLRVTLRDDAVDPGYVFSGEGQRIQGTRFHPVIFGDVSA
jgi:hypothetical protein